MFSRKQFDSSFNAVAVIESVVWPLITSKTSTKCVDNECETRYIRDSVVLLNQLDIEHPVGQYVVSVCNGFLKQYKTGGDTLLFFLCQWTKAASLLCEMGVPRTVIIELLRKVVDDCVDCAELHKIDISQLTREPSHFEDITCSSNLDKKSLDLSEDLVDRIQEHKVQDIHTLSNDNKNDDHIGFDNTKLVEESSKMKTEESFDDEFTEVVLTQEKKMKHTKNSIDISSKKTENISVPDPAACGNSETDFKLTLSADVRRNVPETIVDNVPVINLKMNNVRDTNGDEDDDFSWFFTDDKVLKQSESITTNQDGEKLEILSVPKTEFCDIYDSDTAYTHTNSIEEALKNCGILHNKVEEDQTNADVWEVTQDQDSDLIRDINDLKKNIEIDLEILKKRQRRNGTTRKIEIVHETKSLKSVEKDEFEDSWDVIDGFRDKDNLDDNESILLEEDNKFINIEFIFDKDKAEHKSMCVKSQNTSDKFMEDRKSNNVEATQLEIPQVKPVIQLGGAKTSDLKTIDNLLKSVGCEPKPVSLSKQILNSSRHFRTIKSVLEQPEASISTGCGQNRTILNNTVPVLHNGLYVQSSDQAIQNTSIDNNKSVNQSFRSRHYQKKRSEDQPALSDVEAVKTTQLKSLNSTASNVGMSKISVSGLNKLLNNLTTYSGTHSPLFTAGMTEEDLETDFKQNVNSLSVGNSVKSAISVRSRHLNRDPKEEGGTAYEIDNEGFIPKDVSVKSHESVNIESSENPSLILRCSDCHEDVLRNFPVTIFETVNPSMTYEQVNYVSNTVCKDHFDDVQHDRAGSDRDMKVTGVKSLLPWATVQNLREKRPESLNVQHILESLLNRNDECIVKVICDLVSRLKCQGTLSLLDKLVYSYPICGLKADPRLVHGWIIKTSIDCVTSLQKLNGKPCRILLVNGDISARYRHKGYKSANTSTTYTVESFYNYSFKSDKWTQQITKVLQQLSVDMILARGRIHEEMMSVCGYLDIVPIESVPHPQLKLLSDITETDMVTYVKLSTEDNVCTGIKVSQLESDLAYKNVFNADTGCKIVLTLENNNPQTVVLSEMTTALVDLKEQEFWDCLHQVTSCLKSGSVLPGNAETEILCLEHLQKNKDLFLQTYDRCNIPNKDYLAIVYEKIEQSFLKYADNFHQTRFAMNSDCIYDDYSSKVAAWRVACNTVCTILNLEFYNITGMINSHKTRNGVQIL